MLAEVFQHQEIKLKIEDWIWRSINFKLSNFQRFKLNKMSKRIDFVKGLAEMNDADLKARIQEDELRMKKLEFAHAISPLENPMTIRSIRKDLARLKTELNKRKLGA
jgi:large subunit ribosomal protein L29